ncbi:MAG: DUF1573 domain-containing protein [Saprospiraceae bacterium]
MKKLLSFIALFALTISVSFAQVDKKAATTVDGPNMKFDVTEIDYGTIEKNADPLRIFNFVNEGTEPLVIKHAKGSCGCTVPKYPKEPILPGEAATIEVRYDTKRVGPFSKTVTLTTNEAVQKRVLKIKGKVNKPAPEPDAIPVSEPSILSPVGGGSK